jgi:hypothetical protein
MVLVLVSAIPVSFAQEIPITVTGTLDQVIFDGKWSFVTEWKATTLTVVDTQTADPIYLRTAHQGNFVYVMIDATEDRRVTKNSDSAIVCFDTKNERKSTPNANDYCFMVVLDGKSYILQGGSPLAADGNLAIIPNPEGFIGIGSVSDDNDRYTTVPHASYEFKIPTSLIGRSDTYGFYVGVFDSHKAKVYSWPSVPSGNNLLYVPSPSSWGNLVSPDKSLPEFLWPVLVLISSLAIITYMTRRSTVFYK